MDRTGLEGSDNNAMTKLIIWVIWLAIMKGRLVVSLSRLTTRVKRLVWTNDIAIIEYPCDPARDLHDLANPVDFGDREHLHGCQEYPADSDSC